MYNTLHIYIIGIEYMLSNIYFLPSPSVKSPLEMKYPVLLSEILFILGSYSLT